MEFSNQCVYINTNLVRTMCCRHVTGFGFCDEHINNTNNRKYNKLSMKVLHHCCINNNSILINECISYYSMNQHDIDEVISSINLSSNIYSDTKDLFRKMLLSTKYFPAVNNYQAYISSYQNKITWWTDKMTQYNILYKRFLIKLIIMSISEEFTGFSDLLPHFLDPGMLMIHH